MTTKINASNSANDTQIDGASVKHENTVIEVFTQDQINNALRIVQANFLTLNAAGDLLDGEGVTGATLHTWAGFKQEKNRPSRLDNALRDKLAACFIDGKLIGLDGTRIDASKFVPLLPELNAANASTSRKQTTTLTVSGLRKFAHSTKLDIKLTAINPGWAALKLADLLDVFGKVDARLADVSVLERAYAAYMVVVNEEAARIEAARIAAAQKANDVFAAALDRVADQIMARELTDIANDSASK